MIIIVVFFRCYGYCFTHCKFRCYQGAKTHLLPLGNQLLNGNQDAFIP